jgi:hypothetical protein
VDAAFMLLELNAAWLKLIMVIGPAPHALKSDFQGVRTHWIRGFMAFQLAGHEGGEPGTGGLGADRDLERPDQFDAAG